MGRRAQGLTGCHQAAASENLHNAIFRGEHAPSVLEIFLHDSMQQKNEHTLERARDRKEIM